MRRLWLIARGVLDAGAQPIRSVRGAFDTDLRRVEPRRQRHYVRVVLVAGFVVVVAIAAGVLLGTWLVLVAVVAAFAVRALVLAWRARASLGHDEHWPVGSLRPGPEGVTHIDHYSDLAARYGPVFKTAFYERPTGCIVDLGIATDVLREHAGQLAPPWDPPGRFVPGGSIRGSDEVRNADLRRLYARTLTAGLVRSWEPTFSRRMSDALTAITQLPDAGSPGVNPRPLIRSAMRGIWSEICFGIAPDTTDFAEATALMYELDPDLHMYGTPLPDADLHVGLDRLAALIRGACSTRDRSVVATTWAERIEEEEPGSLDDPSHVRNLIFTAVTSYDDVTGLHSWLLWYLADAPELIARLRADPDDAPRLADRIVSEGLRLAQSEFVIREARVDVQVGDRIVPEGWLMRACLRESHRDPAKFDRPTTFDPDRFAGERMGRDRYSPFGLDHRSCLGEQLTRTAARVFVLTIANDLDVVTRRGGPPELGEKRHWATNSHWLLTVRLRAAAERDARH